jgi:hypothetical protein
VKYLIDYALITPCGDGVIHPMKHEAEAGSYAEAAQSLIDELSSELIGDDRPDEGSIYNFYVVNEDGSKYWGIDERE